MARAALSSLVLLLWSSSAAGAPGVRPVCGGTREAGPRCNGLEALTLSGGRVKNGRGRVPAPGETGTIEVQVRNPTARAVAYPCVGFAADQAGITFGADNPKVKAYALAPGATASYEVTVTVGATVRPGATVRFTAWLDVLHGGCGNGQTLVWTTKLP